MENVNNKITALEQRLATFSRKRDDLRAKFLTESAMLTSVITELENERAEFLELKKDRFGPDEFAAGTIITFNYAFQVGGVRYMYAILKCDNGLWYSTGPKSPKAYSWTELTRWLNFGDANNFRVIQPKKGKRMINWDSHVTAEFSLY